MNFGRSGNINSFDGMILYCFDDEMIGSLCINNHDSSLELNSNVENILEKSNSPLSSTNSIFMSEFIVHDKFRNQGYGVSLLKETERFSNEIGIDYIFLTCDISNERAKNLYDKFGFEEVGRNDEVCLLLYKIKNPTY